MATDLAQIDDAPLTIARIARIILDQAHSMGHFPASAQDCAGAATLAGDARGKLRIAAGVTSDSTAKELSVLRCLQIDATAPLEQVAAFKQCAAEVQVKNATALTSAKYAARAARLARRGYEDLNPDAALWLTKGDRWRVAIRIGAGTEIGAAGYMLSQLSSFPGGIVGCAIAAAAFLIGNGKAGVAAGRLFGRRGQRWWRKWLGRLLASGLVLSAVVADLLVGLLRADLPFTIEAIRLLATKPVEHLAAWVVVGMEFSVFVGCLAWASGRERAGDGPHYRALLAREAVAEEELLAVLAAIERNLDATASAHCSAVDDVELAARETFTSADAACSDVSAQRRQLFAFCEGLRIQGAMAWRSAYELASSEWQGSQPQRRPAWEPEFRSLIVEPDAAAADHASALGMREELTKHFSSLLRGSRVARLCIGAIRLAALRFAHSA